MLGARNIAKWRRGKEPVHLWYLLLPALRAPVSGRGALGLGYARGGRKLDKTTI